MTKNKNFKKFLGTILVGGMVLAVGGVAMASSNTNGSPSLTKPFFVFSKGGQKQKVMMKVFDPAKMKEEIQAHLKTLVEGGKITQEKADKVADYLVNFAKSKKAEMDKVKNMTAQERKQYFKNNKTTFVDPFTKMVNEGVITQTEADAIKTLMSHKQGRPDHRKGMGMENFDAAKMKANMQSKLSVLVKNGKLTQDKADKVAEYFAKLAEERKAEFDKIKKMTEQERKQYFENKKANLTKRNGPLTQLVKDGVITQTEADAIKNLMPHKNFKQGKMRQLPPANTTQQTTETAQQTLLDTL